MTSSGTTTGTDVLRLAESAAEAALILALVVVPTGLRVLDVRLAVVLTGMLIGLTLGAYALHAVTFDYFRITGGPGVTGDDAGSAGSGEPHGPRRPYSGMTTASASRRHRLRQSPAGFGGPHRRPTPGVTDVQTRPAARR
jgi:hypothetical protein